MSYGWERDQLAYNGLDLFYTNGNQAIAIDQRGNPRAVDKKELDEAHRAFFNASYKFACRVRDAGNSEKKGGAK